jgi:hypothetical protein
VDPDPDPKGRKTCGSVFGFGSRSGTRKKLKKFCPNSVEYLEKGKSALFLCIQCVTSRQLAEIALPAILLIHTRQSLRREKV